jgi:hypothetical protein
MRMKVPVSVHSGAEPLQFQGNYRLFAVRAVIRLSADDRK